MTVIVTHATLATAMAEFRKTTPSAIWNSAAEDLELLWPYMAAYCKGAELLDVGCGDGALWTNLGKTTLAAVYGVDLLPSKSWSALTTMWGETRCKFFVGSPAVLRRKENEQYRPTVAFVKNVLPWLSWPRIRELMFSLPPSVDNIFFVDRVSDALPIRSVPPRSVNLVSPPMGLKMTDHTYFYDSNDKPWSICFTTDLAAWRARQNQPNVWEPCPSCESDQPPIYTISASKEYEFQCESCGGMCKVTGIVANDNAARALWNNHVRSVYVTYQD